MRNVSALSACLLTGLVLLSGCGDAPESDLRVSLKESGGLTANSPVRWRGIDIGRVESVEVAPEGVQVAITLSPEHRRSLRSGASAKAKKAWLEGAAPYLEIFGGSDPQQAVLAHGALLPEAGMVVAMDRTQLMVAGAAILGLTALAWILKALRKITAFILALALLAFSTWFFHQQWQRHGSDILGAETEAKLSELADKAIRSPEAQAAWRSIQQDVNAVMSEAGKQGKEALEVLRAAIQKETDAQIDELKAAGKQQAADNLRELKGSLLQFLDGAEAEAEPPRPPARAP